MQYKRVTIQEEDNIQRIPPITLKKILDQYRTNQKLFLIWFTACFSLLGILISMPKRK